MAPDLTGITAALLAAFFWAIATRLFRQMSGYWTPAALATIKAATSTLLFLAWFLVTDISFWQHETHTIAWLLFSGVIGIALGDTALFYALYRMTERETLLVAETTAPVFVILAAFLLLGESLTLIQVIGVLTILIGIDMVIGITRGIHFNRAGVVFALVAAACQAFGMIVSRKLLTETSISAEETALWRLMGACLVLPFWLLFRGETLMPAIRLTPAVTGRLAIAILLGTFLGVWLLQISVDLLPAGIAQSLIVTSVVFATLISVARGDKVTILQWIGVLTAVTGVTLLLIF